MNYLSLVLKNKQYNQIVTDFVSGKANHAYMLCSNDSLFIQNIAFSLAAHITSSTINRVESNIHPDVFIYGKNGKIDANATAEIISDLNVAPYEADKKVYCLLNIENMNDTSQNKILKSLEEPPKNVVFILTCSNTKSVLSTVLSRVKVVNIDAIAENDILELLKQSGAKADAAEIAVSCAGGNSTLANKLTSSTFLQMYNNIITMLTNVKSSKDCLEYVSLFDNKNIDKGEFLDTCILLLRDISMLIAGNRTLVVNRHHLGILDQIANQFTLKAVANIITQCLRLKEDLYYNTNTTAVLDKFMLKLAQEKVKCKK